LNRKRIVLGYCGDAASLDVITSLAHDQECTVIAVAFDLGAGAALSELRDRALAAGAARCHAMDVREELLRDYVVPALRGGRSLDAAGLADIARTLVNKTLVEIARAEDATVSPSILRQVPMPATAGGYAFDSPATLEIRFTSGEPSAVNGIHMTMVEIVESIETITRSRALDVLALAYTELRGDSDGAVLVRVARGAISVGAPAVVR
jgi:argininosuccinate synthase